MARQNVYNVASIAIGRHDEDRQHTGRQLTARNPKQWTESSCNSTKSAKTNQPLGGTNRIQKTAGRRTCGGRKIKNCESEEGYEGDGPESVEQAVVVRRDSRERLGTRKKNLKTRRCDPVQLLEGTRAQAARRTPKIAHLLNKAAFS
jgi:hypothetical protein